MQKDKISSEIVKLCQQYSIKQQLGQGAFALVFKAIDKKDGKMVAIKCVDKQKHINKQKNKQLKQLKTKLMESEVQILMDCDNQHIVKCYDTIDKPNWKIIVQQYCEGGSLYDMIERKGTLTEQQALQVLSQLIKGFAYLHKKKIIHRDLKTQNILVHKGVYKIADFGLAKIKNELTRATMGTTVGSSFTMAPQVMRGDQYDIQADIWSIGIIYYEMLTSFLPFFKNVNQETILKVNQNINQMQISQKSKIFLKSIFVINPKNRLKWVQLYKMYNNQIGLFIEFTKSQNQKQKEAIVNIDILATKQIIQTTPYSKKQQPSLFPNQKQINQVILSPLQINYTALSTQKQNLTQIKPIFNTQKQFGQLSVNKIQTSKTQYQKFEKSQKQQINQPVLQLKTVGSDLQNLKIIKLINNFEILEQIYKNALQPIFSNIQSIYIKQGHDFQRVLVTYILLVISQVTKIIDENQNYIYAQYSIQQIKMITQDDKNIIKFNEFIRTVNQEKNRSFNQLNRLISGQRAEKNLKFNDSFLSSRNYLSQKDVNSLEQRYLQYQCSENQHIITVKTSLDKAINQSYYYIEKKQKNILLQIKSFLNSEYSTLIQNRVIK